MRDDTLLVHAARTRPGEGPLPPIYQASTFRLHDAAEGARVGVSTAPDRYYSRWGNPTVRALEETLASVEGAPRALATGSGMGAISALFLHLAKGRSSFVSQRALYSGTAELLHGLLPEFGVETTFVPGPDDEGWKNAITRGVGLVYLETPSNPAMEIADIRLVCDLAADAGVPVAVDNTFATPINQKPLALGATYVVHSATKYLSGHGDASGGIVAGPAAAIDELWRTYKLLGPSLAPMEAYLILRGMRTMGLRVRRQNASALALAQWLERHPQVARVQYPGLASDPGHAVAARQMSGFGGMLSVDVRGGLAVAQRVVENTRLFVLAVSLGGVDSLIQHPATMTHAPLTPAQRAEAGVTDGLLRLSVGIEDVEDLKEDLDRALSG